MGSNVVLQRIGVIGKTINWFWVCILQKLFEILKPITKNQKNLGTFYSNVSQYHILSWDTFHKHDKDTHSLWLSMWKRGFRQCAQRKTPRFNQWEQSKQRRLFSHSLSGSRHACLKFPLWRTKLTPNPLTKWDIKVDLDMINKYHNILSSNFFVWDMASSFKNYFFFFQTWQYVNIAVCQYSCVAL